MSNHRFIKFYPQDWLADHKLRLCDPACRGIWIDLLCLMHAAGGYLKLDGKRPQPRQISRVLCVRPEQYERCIRALLEHGVASITNDGTIFCQRMVDDCLASAEGKANAERRWGGPDPNGGANGSPNGSPNGKPNAKKKEYKKLEKEPPKSPTADAAGDLRSRASSDATRDSKIPWRSGALQLVYEEGMAELAGAPDPEQQRAAGRALNEAWNSFRPLPKAAQ